MNVKTSIIIPAYNEESGVEAVLSDMSRIVNSSYEVIVVDDGSEDRTYEVAKRFDVRLFSHKKKMGKGSAMMTGIKNAMGENVIFIDADNTYPVDAIHKIVEKLDQGYGMVIGSRFAGKAETISKFNRGGNKVFRFMLEYLYKSKTSDPLTGLYGIKTRHIENMDLISSGFEIETEIAIKSSRMGLKIGEIPIHYNTRLGEVKLHPIKDGYRILRAIAHFMPIYSSTYMFSLPGTLLFTTGLILILSLTIKPIKTVLFFLDIQAFILGCLMIILGLQVMIFGISSKMYAMIHKFGSYDMLTKFVIQHPVLKAMQILGVLSFIAGFYIGSKIVKLWIDIGFSPITELRSTVLASTLIILGIQLIFSVLYIGIFSEEVKKLNGVGNKSRSS